MQPRITCTPADGRCSSQLGLISEQGELVLRGRHHGTWHETRVSLLEVVQQAVAGGCLNPAMKQELIAVLEG
jgi:hypothetical protein